MPPPSVLKFLNAHGARDITIIVKAVAMNIENALRLFLKRNTPKMHQPTSELSR
jgi:hypothetical protein